MYNRLLQSVTEYERTSELINEILHAVAVDLSELSDESMQNYDEIFIDTAVRSLQIHAKDLGIRLGSHLNVQQQRELITAHYRAAFEQTTEETIKNVASAFSNGEVEINKTDTPGVFEIKFVGSKGIPDNMEGLQNTISYIVPAHLMFIYTYMFNVWNDVAHMTWSEASNYTWDELLNEELS